MNRSELRIEQSYCTPGNKDHVETVPGRPEEGLRAQPQLRLYEKRIGDQSRETKVR